MKNLIIFIILVVMYNSCNKHLNQLKENNFHIIGKVDHIFDSTKVFLKVQKSNKIITLDTTYIIKKNFQFSGSINKPEVYGIYIDSLNGSIGLFIQNDSVLIDVNENNLSDSKIKGSKLNDQYLRFIKKSNQIVSKTSYLFPLFQKARTENNVNKLNELNKKIETIHNENTTFILNFSRENPDSYIAAFALQSLLKNKSVPNDTIALIYNKFSHEVKKGDFAIEILLYLENQESIENVEN